MSGSRKPELAGKGWGLVQWLTDAITPGKLKNDEATNPLLDNPHDVIDPAPTFSEGGPPEGLPALKRSQTVTASEAEERAKAAEGNVLYAVMHAAVVRASSSSEQDFNEAAAGAFKLQAAGPNGAREKLEGLLSYLHQLNNGSNLSYEAAVSTQDYLAEVRARLAASKKNIFRRIFRRLSDEEVVQHAELAFALITQLKRFDPAILAVAEEEVPALMLVTGDGEHHEAKAEGATVTAGRKVHLANELDERIVKRGEKVAKQLPMEKWKVAVGFFLVALGFLTALVAVGTVITLAMNPATAPAFVAGAVFASKFGLEASIVAAIYFMAEIFKYFQNKWSALPAKESRSTTEKLRAVLTPACPTKKQAIVGTGATLLVGAPAAIAGIELVSGAVINPVSVAVSSASAEAATGSATVATATGAGAVMSLTAIAVTFFAGIGMMTRGKNFIGARNLAADEAKKVLSKTPPPPSTSGTQNSRSIR